ncbi:MAG: hypothetical protein ABH859_08605 [Pseudomonadota bacterium]
MLALACPSSNTQQGQTGNGGTDNGTTGETTEGTQTATTPAAQLLQPEDLQYLGAFRLPDGAVPNSWEWNGDALTYYPEGANAGLPGSLFGTGNGPTNYVSEISIPAPVNSRNLAALNTADTRQGFADIRGGLVDHLMEVPFVALEYFSTPTTGPKIHFAWGANLQGEEAAPSHGWFDLNLAVPNTQGLWTIGSNSPNSVNDYIFAIPTEWADANVGSRYLATGRFKDGGLGGKGPSLFAYAPWLQGNPPAAGTVLNEVTLLKYGSTFHDDETTYRTRRMTNYHDADSWAGGAWITTASGKSGVIFVGTKSTGNYYWYGYVDRNNRTRPCVEPEELSFITCRNANGTACSEDLFAGCGGEANWLTEKGWRGDRFDAQIIFYDPANLAEVVAGNMESYVPQPYATMDIDEYLFLPDISADIVITFGAGDQRKYRVSGVAYDRTNNYLYVMEPFADESKPVIHVWKIN